MNLIKYLVVVIKKNIEAFTEDSVSNAKHKFGVRILLSNFLSKFNKGSAAIADIIDDYQPTRIFRYINSRR